LVFDPSGNSDPYQYLELISNKNNNFIFKESVRNLIMNKKIEVLQYT